METTFFIEDMQGCFGKKIFQAIQGSTTVQEQVDDNGVEIDQRPQASFFGPERFTPA